MNFANIIEQYWKAIVGAIAVVILGGGGYVVVTNQTQAKEQKIQESYYGIEKKLIDLKQRAVAPPAADKKAEVVDFTEVKKELENFVTANTGSIAAQMAALHLAELFVNDKKETEALALLQKVETTNKGMVNSLVQQQIAQLLSSLDKCQEAITVWQKVLERKEASFLHNEMKLQQALCHAKLGNGKQAEEILTNLSNQSTGSEVNSSSVSKEAEKYLRLLKFKKAIGG